MIINNISIGGLVADPGYGAYNVTKFGLAAMTRLVAKEHGSDGVRCVGVCPGPIDTQMAVANRRLVADLAGVSDDEASEMLVSEAAAGPVGHGRRSGAGGGLPGLAGRVLYQRRPDSHRWRRAALEAARTDLCLRNRGGWLGN